MAWISNGDFDRIDRVRWDTNITNAQFDKMYDAHMILKPFVPAEWARIVPLLKLMYGEGSTEKDWANNYAIEFYDKIKKHGDIL